MHLGVPGLESERVAELPLACGFDLSLAAPEYFQALGPGEVPLLALFGGTVYREVRGRLRLDCIERDAETHYRMPVAVWREMREHHYPDCASLSLSRQAYEARR